MLTQGADAPLPAGGAGGNPAPSLDAAQQAVLDAQNGPPEYIPEKFWDPSSKAPKVEELGRGYINLEKLLGREKVPRPVSEEDEEGWKRWYDAAGRPEAPDKYEFKRPDGLPSDLPYDQEMEDHFRTWAHINGLNQRQAGNLYDTFVKSQLERHSAWETGRKQERAKIEGDLRREYGGQYEQKVNLARVALRQYADPDYLRWLDESGMGNDPRMIRAWIRVGESNVGETKLKGNAPAAPAVQDMDRAISEFREKYKEALFKREHPDHDMRVKEYNRLFEARYGEQ